MEPRVSLITLGVTDLARSRRFYETAFGWTASSASQDNVVFFRTAGVVVALHPRDLLAEDANLPAAGSGFAGITLAHNVPERTDVERLLAQAEAAGAPILKPAQDVFWGGYNGYFADPDGYAWEIAWNPGFPLAPDGAIILPD